MAMEKTFDAAGAEARISAKWISENAFAAGKNARAGKGAFSVMIPPPNVTGSLHMGHAFNNTLQDILVRWHRMRGFDTLWQPGTDHAGIATQMVTEREMAKNGEPSRREMGRDAFLSRVWEQKRKSRGTIIGQLQRLGASADWSREAFTMSGAPNAPKGEEGNFHDAVIKVFVDLYNKGFIYRGKRLVNWDPHFETAISDLEVEQIEVTGAMHRLRYALCDGQTYQAAVEFDEDGNATAWETRDYITVATTRPETMLGDTGIAVHPEDARYAHLIGQHVMLPLVNRRIPIVADDYADPTKGTGAVKITPAHDFNDWGVGQRQGLRIINVMDTKAAMALVGNADFLADAAPSAECLALHGQDRYAARKQVLHLAEEQGWLDGIDPDKHFVPHGDRSKVAIEPLLTFQWFVDASKIVQPALDAVREGRVKIIPESGEKTYYHWLDNIEPWCISRQLWWGHQIPVWYDAEGNHYCAATEAEAVALSGGKALTRDPDVLDTWFSSGLWPIGTLGWPDNTPELQKYFPTSVLVTGQDILFFWVARMMMMQLAVVNDIPFHTVYLHGLVRDAKGKKMSKSLGNVIDPLEIIDEFGADALRFTNAAMASLGGVLKLDTQRIAGYRNFGTKLWNACRFAEMNGVWEGYETRSTAPTATATANRWIIGETVKCVAEVDAALAEYRFDQAADVLYKFVWGKVCDWYVEFAKPLFDGDAAGETRATMAWVLDHCMILLHPMMPFITEELWATTGKRAKMLVHTDWPELSTDLVDTASDREMNWVTGLIDDIRSARAQVHVPAGLKIDVVATQLSDEARAALANNQSLIQRIARIDQITSADTAPKGSIAVAAEGATFAIPLAGIIDIAEEKARLQKTLDKLAKEIGGLKGRLNNPAFVASAPEDVVIEARGNLDAREDEAAKLSAALSRLAEIG